MATGPPAKQSSPQLTLNKHSSSRDASKHAEDDSSKRRGNTPDDFNGGLKRQNTSRSNMSSNNSSRMQTSKGGNNRKAKQERDQFRYLSEIVKRAITIKEELNKFDRALADSVKPLTDIQDRNIYEQVLSKFTKGEEKLNDAEELRQAIDRMQVQLKKNVNTLDKLDKRINDSLAQLINARVSMFRGDDEMFRDMGVLVDLLNESLSMKKFNLIGCKMKIYQERMREIK